MTEFKRGDRVRYVGTYTEDLHGEVGTVDEQTAPGNVYVDWDCKTPGDYKPRGVLPENIEKIEPSKLSFVGPEPEPAEAPAVTTPFKTIAGNCIEDSRGYYVGEISGVELSNAQDSDLAALVVRLLNDHFGAE